MTQISSQLTALRYERAEQEASRSLREQQDQAYQQSLLADQEKVNPRVVLLTNVRLVVSRIRRRQKRGKRTARTKSWKETRSKPR